MKKNHPLSSHDVFLLPLCACAIKSKKYVLLQSVPCCAWRPAGGSFCSPAFTAERVCSPFSPSHSSYFFLTEIERDARNVAGRRKCSGKEFLSHKRPATAAQLYLFKIHQHPSQRENIVLHNADIMISLKNSFHLRLVNRGRERLAWNIWRRQKNALMLLMHL